MTVGPDLDWLADDEGNLRPEVARGLQDAPPAAPAARAVRPITPRPRPLAAQHFPPAVRAPGRSISVAPILLGVSAALIGFGLGVWHVGNQANENKGLLLTPSAHMAGRTAFANGVNVNVRSGPGLGYPPIVKLASSEGLQVGVEQEGWFAVTTNTGLNGWVFGAFLHGQSRVDRGAAVVTQTLTTGADTQRVVLRPGDKVFVVQNTDGHLDVILPTGRKLRITPEAIARVD